MAIVKKRREAKVGLKPGYTLNGEIKEQQQDDNEVKYSNKKMEVTETYHQNCVIDNYHKKINEFKKSAISIRKVTEMFLTKKLQRKINIMGDENLIAK